MSSRWLAVGLLGLLTWSNVSEAKEPIRIGEINSFTGIAAPFTGPYKNGVELAVKQVNERGGINGREVVVLFRDDKGQPAEAQREAEELAFSQKADLIAGTFLSNVALAVSTWARDNEVMFVAAEPLTEALTWKSGHDYVVRVRPNTYEQGRMLADAVHARKLKFRKWATIGPNYEYGTRAWATFSERLKQQQPDVEIVGEFWPPLGKLDPPSFVSAILNKQPEALYVSLFGSDWLAFVREAKKRDLFKKMYVVGILLGEPEYLEPLKDEVPEGVLVTGYPRDQITTPEHNAFVTAYRKAYHEEPMLGSLVGYITYQSIFAALRRAGNTDAKSLSRAFKNLPVDTPIGKLQFRDVDGQSTMGAWVGTLTYDKKRKMPAMTGFTYVKGEQVLPPASYVAAERESSKK